jgi:hypothetical protein
MCQPFGESEIGPGFWIERVWSPGVNFQKNCRGSDTETGEVTPNLYHN